VRLIAALFAATALALLNLVNLAGAGYARFASQHLDRPDAAATLAATRIAAQWPPWSSAHVALHGWVLAENRQEGAALAAYLEALRLAPGDPLLWSEYGLALARLGQFGPALTLAVTQGQRLAPNSPAVQRAVADLGLGYWSRGTPEQRALWLEGMRRELDRNRAGFLGHVLTRGQGMTFCRDPALRLGEAPWCESIASALLGGCYVLTPAQPVPCAAP